MKQFEATNVLLAVILFLQETADLTLRSKGSKEEIIMGLLDRLQSHEDIDFALHLIDEIHDEAVCRHNAINKEA